jgi:hypothetical protein
MDLREVGWDGMDWIDLVQNRDKWRVLLNKLINIRVQYNFWKFLSSYIIGGFSRRVRLQEVS